VTLTNPFTFLQQNADAHPDGVFLRSPDHSMTNAEAVVEVKKLAYELRRLGVRAGDIVALELPDQLSLLFTEAVYHEAAISTVIPAGHLVGEAFDVAWIFSTTTPLPQGDARIVTVDAQFLRQVDQNPYGIRPSEEAVEVLRIVFSSGTTGTPKAIALGRRMERAMDAALASWFAGGPSVTMMDTGSAAGIGEFFLSVKGGQPFLSAGGAAPDAIARLLADNGVRTLKGSPNQVAALVDHLERVQGTLPTLETVVVSGTVLPPSVQQRLQEVTGGCVVVSNYGSTEAGAATRRTTDSGDPFDVGRVQPGSEVQIVDDDDVEVPAGTVGRIRHRSLGMAEGYLGDDEATARAFRDGWFYPGDLGLFRPDGGLTLVGREAEVLNAGGVKIDPNRLDHAALGHPLVRDACSFAYAGPSGIARIGMAVVADDGVDLAGLAEELTDEFGTSAPTLMARVTEIPRTATGKPRRRELAERFAES
jgi:acyl-CoA synthetase (AMP-forming)/AMP-acid ligase II